MVFRTSSDGFLSFTSVYSPGPCSSLTVFQHLSVLVLVSTFFHCVSYHRWFDLALVHLISWYSFSYDGLDALVCHCRYPHLISVRTLINPYIFNFLYELISATTHLMDLGSPQCTTALHTVTYHKKGMRLQNKPCIAIPVLKAPRKTIGVIYRYNDSLSTANAGGWVSRSF